MTVYRCRKQRFKGLPDLEPYDRYGIIALKDGMEILCIPDISTAKDEVVALAAKCTELQLDPLHLQDIVEDFLATT